MELVRDKLANRKYRHGLISPHTGTSTDNLGQDRTYDMRRTPWREPSASLYVFWARNQNGQVFWRYVSDVDGSVLAQRIIAEHFRQCDYRVIDAGLAIRGAQLSDDENLIFHVGIREDDDE